MPTFTCTTSVNRLSIDQKKRIVELLGTVFSEEFGGPRFIVQVLFHELPEGQRFFNDKTSPVDNVFIRGEIRAGRTNEQKTKVVMRIIDLASKAIGIERFHFSVYLVELAKAAEFGTPVPNPGEEGDLFTTLPQTLMDAYNIKLSG